MTSCCLSETYDFMRMTQVLCKICPVYLLLSEVSESQKTKIAIEMSIWKTSLFQQNFLWKYDLSLCVSKDEVDFLGKRLKKTQGNERFALY